MSIINKKIEKEQRALSFFDIFKISMFVILLFCILSLRYVFPDSPFIQKYFTGYYAVLWFLLLVITALIHDFLIP